MSGNNVTLELKNKLSELKKLHQHVEQFGASLGLSRETIFHLNLVLEELVTNVISYGYTDEAEHLIRITLSEDNGTIHLCLEDDGIPFNPIRAKKPDLDTPVEGRQIGKVGIHFCKELMKNLKYERREGKNIISMKKEIKKKDDTRAESR
ncbi:MAG: ATP-binding protein [Deltaproteobacteria bacterium]|nr:ATP-binding protein [Deltaproteobacteria bacterium]MBW2072593.1 ATP-binding protein [Deltaproteobacteria bacterium]